LALVGVGEQGPARTPVPQAPRLRVAVFADARLQPRWVAGAFASVARSDCAQIIVVGIGAASHGEKPWVARAYRGLDRWAFGADGSEPVDLVAAIAQGRTLAPPFRNLLELDLDVAFALGAVDEAPLDGVARLGVWRFQVDGAAEVAAGELLTASALAVRLAPGAVPRLACQSWARTDPFSVSRNRAALLQKTAQFPLRALREARRSGREWLEQRPLASVNQGQTTISVSAEPQGNRGLSLISIGSRILRRGVEKALAIEQWSLAFSFAQRDPNPQLGGFTRIVPPPDRDWSEPFALAKNGRYYVFFKEMVRGADKAHIAMLELSADGRWSAPVRVLERDYHVAHPFVVEHDGQLYLIPESARNRTVEAYRCVDFPRRWRLERVLLDGVRLVDATFHRSAERCWLFANGAAGEGGGFNDELHLFHARGLLDEWQPHGRNPVRSDARCARPAGALYWRNGALYRPGQICVPRYGAGITLNRVLRLTPETYAERQIERIVPAPDAGLLGMHTVNRAADLTLVDVLTRRRRL
jgi:hypothetical protein